MNRMRREEPNLKQVGWHTHCGGSVFQISIGKDLSSLPYHLLVACTLLSGHNSEAVTIFSITLLHQIVKNRVLFDPHEALASGRWGLTRVFSRRTRYIGAYKPISVSWYIRYSVHHVRRTPIHVCWLLLACVCVICFEDFSVE